MSCLPKPVLRGHCRRYGIRKLAQAVILGMFGSAMCYTYVMLPRRKAYYDFLKNYDAEAHYKELVKYDMVYHSGRDSNPEDDKKIDELPACQ